MTTVKKTTAPCFSGAWQPLLQQEFEQPYMNQLRDFLREQKKQKKIIFPQSSDVFNAFQYTKLEEIKVVILGQDPYHGVGQAHGLCFSVQQGVRIPPSLQNIYKELHSDLNIPPAKHGCLTAWAKQGVLLLNSVLTVECGQANSHQGKGWEIFTDRVIALVNQQPQPICFVLWGAYAQRKGQMIDEKKHFVIRSAHPSPLSAHRGFFGSRPFSKINQFLEKNHRSIIRWQLDSLPN